MHSIVFLSTPKILAGVDIIDMLGKQLGAFGKEPLILIGSG